MVGNLNRRGQATAIRMKTSIQKWGNSLAVIKPDAGPDLE
jgi:hypothetical protein